MTQKMGNTPLQVGGIEPFPTTDEQCSPLQFTYSLLPLTGYPSELLTQPTSPTRAGFFWGFFTAFRMTGGRQNKKRTAVAVLFICDLFSGGFLWSNLFFALDVVMTNHSRSSCSFALANVINALAINDVCASVYLHCFACVC